MPAIKLFSQLLVPPDTSNPVRKPDTVCVRLKFNVGDTLFYKVVSYDSLSIDYEEPVQRTRLEYIQVICDSIDSKEHYHLNIKLVKYSCLESNSDIKNQKSSDSPWLGRNVYIEIDSLGDRISCSVDDSTNFAMAPGGAFQPYLFFPILRSCKGVDETWIVNSHDKLVENGAPVPAIKQFSLMRMNHPVDTLGERCASMEYVRTSQGSESIIQAGYRVFVTSVMNGFGVIRISLDKFIPIHYYATVEQKLTLSFPNNVSKPGYHYIVTNYTLDRYA